MCVVLFVLLTVIVQIVDDVLNLARADYVNYTLALETVQYLEKESNYIPWLAALNNLAYVYRRIEAKDLGEYKVRQCAYPNCDHNQRTSMV